MIENQKHNMRVLAVTGNSDIAEAHMFIGLAQRGCKLSIISEPKAKFNDAFVAAGMELTELKINGRFDKAAQAVIRNLIQEKSIQIVHAMNNRTVANALVASKGLSVRFIAYRGIEGNDSYYDPFSWQTYLNPRVDRVICVADAIRKYLTKISFLGYRQPASKFVTIYKGHDLNWYNQPRNDLSEFGIPSNAFVIGSVANERPRKGLPILVEAFSQLDIPGAHLLLVGKIDSDQLAKQIAASPAHNRIHLTGMRPDAPSLMSACSIYVIPAIKREGLPRAVIEAMAYNVPPIVTDSGGSPELIEDGKSGLVVKSGDANALAIAIRQMFNMEDTKRKAMGEAARQRISEQFDIQKTIEKTWSLYTDII